MASDKIKGYKFASIDIGSNAIRLLLKRVYDNGSNPVFKKDSLVRIPVRLGDDSFMKKAISDKKSDKLIKSMIGFKYLIEAYNPIDFMAFATSAMRDASNGQKIVNEIKKQSGIDLQIISGKQEAEVIYSNHIEELLDKKKSYLYIDVGGGSTELTIFSNNKSIVSRSFNIGTIRLLNNIVDKQTWKEVKYWVKENTKDYSSILGIGSGGNINKLFRMSRLKEREPLPFVKIEEMYNYVKDYSIEERIKVLRMRRDRADVIIPATEIFMSVMKWANIKHIFVPQIGLADGIIHVLYEKYKSGNN